MGIEPFLIFSAVVVYGLIHSLLASAWAKDRARQWIGPPADRWYRLVYNLFGFVSLLPVLTLPALLPDARLYVISSPWSYLTLAGQLLAVVALAVGVRQNGAWSLLGLQQALGRPNQKPSQLVTHGLYHWVRHPLYTAGLVFIWLVPVMTRNLLALNIGLTIYLVLGAMFEERKLLREFGEVYLRYRLDTPMLIPRLWRKTRLGS